MIRTLHMEKLQEQVMARLDLSREIEDGELVELIYQVLEEYTADQYIPLRMKMEFGRDLFNAFRKLDILQELLEDETITEIMINGLENIFVEKGGEIHQYEKRFVSRKKLEDIAQQIASGCNRTVNEAEPIVDARLPDGSRVNLVLPPVALNGPIITIRKFPKEGITMKKLVAWGSISKEAAEFLEKLVKAKYNMFISGGTGSGKTTFLNALSQFIPEDEADHHYRGQCGTEASGAAESGEAGGEKRQHGRGGQNRYPGTDPDSSPYETGPGHRRRGEERRNHRYASGYEYRA